MANRARLDLARRKAREKSGSEDLVEPFGLDEHHRELGRALVEEIDRLPNSLREPILLCCVEDLTYDEAATHLQTTAPAVRGRLARARERLRDRLSRRGFAPTAGALGVLLSTEVASASVPRALLMTTTKASLAGTVPAVVEALAEGVIRTMILTKSKILAGAVVAFGVAGSSMGLIAQDAAPTVEPRPASADAERLDKVEKKLDRVLQALERTVPQPSTAPSAVPHPGPLPPPVVAAQPAVPAAATFTIRATNPDGRPDDARITAESHSVTGANRLYVVRRDDLPVPARLDALEARLERLEARLTKLEGRASADRNPDNELSEIQAESVSVSATSHSSDRRPEPAPRPTPAPRPRGGN